MKRNENGKISNKCNKENKYNYKVKRIRTIWRKTSVTGKSASESNFVKSLFGVLGLRFFWLTSVTRSGSTSCEFVATSFSVGGV